MISSDYSAEKIPSFEERQHFISIGNFRHAPNWDSVVWLKETIWPIIRKALPQAELHVVGAYPPKKATELHNPKQGFLLKGWAENASEVMKSARVCLAPLRFGAGLKGKLIDAMCCGTPNVTTSLGAEAMFNGRPWGGMIADTAEEIASSAIELYNEQDQWQLYQQNGFEIIQTVFNAEEYGSALINRISDCLSNLDTHRMENFTGAMLRHHHHKSTEYMAQWIEAKNKLADFKLKP